MTTRRKTAGNKRFGNIGADELGINICNPIFLSSRARQNAVQQKNLQSTTVTTFGFSSGVTKRSSPNIAKP